MIKRLKNERGEYQDVRTYIVEQGLGDMCLKIGTKDWNPGKILKLQLGNHRI